MFKLLIVEDERWEREGLLNFLDWEELGIEIAGTACDGIDGIEQALRIVPDIIITDIKMPGIDGINMARKIKEIHPDTKIVIITGYDDFKLAKDAIAINTSAYVLKPVEEDEMLDVMKRVVLLCEKEKKKLEDDCKTENLLRESQHTVKIKFLQDLFEGRLKSDNLLRQLTDLGIVIKDGRSVVMVIKPYMKDILNIPSGEFEYNAIMEDISKHINEHYGESCMTVLSGNLEAETLVSLSISADNDNLLNMVIDHLKKIIFEKYGVELDIGIGKNIERICDLHISCQQARQAMVHGRLWDLRGSTYYNDVEKLQQDFNNDIGVLLTKVSYYSKQLIHAVRSADEIRVFNLLDELFESLEQKKGAGKDFICNHLCGIISETSLVLYNMRNLIEANIEGESDACKPLLELDSLSSIQEYIFDFFERSLRYISDKRNSKEDYIAQKVIQLIEQKYMTDLCLKTISAEVVLSPNYVGSLFKRFTGKAFNDYLNEYRMEIAKELLKSSKNKVSYVAQKVGVSNTSYFCVVFKNTYGITPGEYQDTVVRS